MERTQEGIERALAAVATSKARRERYERERKEAYSPIQVAMRKWPTYIPKGEQLPLDLH